MSLFMRPCYISRSPVSARICLASQDHLLSISFLYYSELYILLSHLKSTQTQTNAIDYANLYRLQFAIVLIYTEVFGQKEIRAPLQ